MFITTITSAEAPFRTVSEALDYVKARGVKACVFNAVTGDLEVSWSLTGGECWNYPAPGQTVADWIAEKRNAK